MRYSLNPSCNNIDGPKSLISQLGFAYICKHCGTELFWETSFQRADDRPRYDPDSERYKKKIKEWERNWEVAETARLNALEAYEFAIKIETCPICGFQLSQEKGFFLPQNPNPFLRENEWDTDRFGTFVYGPKFAETFERLTEVRKSEDHKQAESDTAMFSTRCNQVIAAWDSKAAAEIKADSEKLKELILHLIHLENNIYSLEQRLPELYYQRLLNDREIVFSSHFPAIKQKEKLAKQRAEVDSLKADVDKYRRLAEGALVAIRNAKMQEPKVYVPEPVKPNEPTLATPGLFNKKKVLAENEALMAKYQADMEKYYIQVSVCEKRKAQLIAAEKASNIQKAEQCAKEVEASLARAERLYEEKAKALDEQSSAITPTTPSASALAAKGLIDQNIAETETLLQKTYAARNELYAYNIVFGKYRNVVALSSFYEYLMSGRCESLEGASGAYNIYEGEIRQNLIIAQLDNVISSLERIEQNQYMLYSELRDINSSLDTMNKTMDKALDSIRNMEGHMEHISENSDVIAHNTAATAFYAKKNAELTDALGYMVALS